MSRRTSELVVDFSLKVSLGERAFRIDVPVGGKGSHTTLRYENPDIGEVRTVTVPKADPIPTGTLQDIADQAGAKDFHEFCRWVKQTS
jgi:predicted RNA binding protein YcfA (HicA-like mRNA interferase family)